MVFNPLSRKGPDCKNKIKILDKIKSMDATLTTDPGSLDFNINNSFYSNPCDKSLDNLKNFNHEPKMIFYYKSRGSQRSFKIW